MKKYNLNKWFVTPDPRDPYMAPEQRAQCLGGDRGDNDCLTTAIMGKTEDETKVTYYYSLKDPHAHS